MTIPLNIIQMSRLLESVNDFPLLESLAGQLISKDDLDEMAFPAYFHGNMLSRAIFFGRLSWFLQPFSIAKGSGTLDFGCGLGLLAPYVAAQYSRYSGIDLNPEVASRYSQELGLEGVDFHRSLQGLDCGQRFDNIISFDVLEHVDDLEIILAQFATLLNPGGKIALCGPTENRLYRFGRKIVGFSGEYHHRNIHDIFTAAGQTGFKMRRRRTWPLPGPGALFECGYFEL